MLDLVLALALQAPAVPETHPFSVADMLAMDRISDPQVSPDGRSVLFGVRTTDVAANKGRTDVWVAPVEGGTPRRLTSHEANDWNARWTPDGRGVVFLSTRGGSAQVWTMPLDGGEATALSSLPLDVEAFEVFPDGRRLLLVIEVDHALAPQEALAGTAKQDAERAASPVQARTYETLLFRHWDAWEDGKSSHLFVWTIGEAQPVDLMAGLRWDAPPKPFGGNESLAISPDGREVVFAARAHAADSAWTTGTDLYRVPAEGGAKPSAITAENGAYDDSPAFSPDGRWLAYLAMERPGYEADRQRIVLVDRRDGAKRVLTGAWDRSPGEISWSRDSKTILAAADDVGHRSLFAVDVASGKVSEIVDAGFNASPRSTGERVVFLQDTLHYPAELFSVANDGSAPRPVTRLNAAKVATARMGAYEPFSFPGWNGETVHGWVVKPADFREGQKYPVAFLIHGGPQGSFGNHFHYRWNPQAYAGAGYAAVFVDFHGSTGYGQAFTDSIRGDWGGKPYEDLIKGLDFALARYPFLDGTRVAALGASYGGYMINWIAGQTDRFRCLVNHDGNLDERMAYYDTEELWFPEWEHGGTPFEKPEGFTKHNPIDHVAKWKTPMLVIHGAKDFRVVDTQGMSTFTALQRKGIPSKLLWFPDENHWVLKPQNSKLWHETVIGWLDRWCRDDGGTAGGARASR